MKKILLVLFTVLFGGCSMNELLLWTELNKVSVIKRTSYITHYRVYFQRDHLKPIRHGKKYLFFYHKKSGDIAILFHPSGSYKLYNITHQTILPTIIRADKKHGYYSMLRALKKKGFRLASPSRHGFVVSVSLRRYKGIKTYRVDVKDYRKLIARYKYAIRTYDAKKINRIKTHLPYSFIRSYFERYLAKAVTSEQKAQLHRIGVKLGLYKTTSKQKKINRQKEAISSSENSIIDPVQETPVISKQKPRDLYHYYLHDASYYELQNYLSTSDAQSALSYNQYNTLKKRYGKMKEEKLLKEGTLEELIAAYKKNNNPKYKTKILARMKELQASEK